MKTRLNRPVSLLLVIIMILSVFTIIPVTTASAATKTDVLTAADFAASDTSYVDFSGVSKTSGAVYAGQSAKNSAGAIQMRSNGSNSGIVSTASGGTVKSVKITVSSGSNTINVYGKNTAYSAASDLYNTGTQGTKVGSLSSTGTITFSDSYEYIGIRSNKGAIYLSSVEIAWDDGTGPDPVEPTEGPTEAPTDPPTDPPTEPPTDPPTEAPTEAPTQAPTLGPVDSDTDALTRADTGIASGASYGTWSGVTKNTDAEYAGNSAGGNDAIQLRSDKSTSGIVTTKSGGTASKVTVAWNSNTTTTSARSIDIYGKNTAYSSASDLYNASSQGTLLGSISYGSDTELTIDGDYKFIGIRSHSGALFLDEVRITWGSASPGQSCTVTWNNWNGDGLDVETYSIGAHPEYSGSTTPTKEYDNEHFYSFSGWTDGTTEYALGEELPTLSGDITYTACFSSIDVSVEGFFIRTDDPSKSYDLVGKWYQYNNNEPAQFEEVGPFDDSGSPIMLCGKYVADYEPEPDENAVFSHSVYVTGSGTENDPYIFTANYTFSKNSGTIVDGATVYVDGAPNTNATTEALPGDGFKAYSRIKVNNVSILYLQHTDDGIIECGSGKYIGVGNGSSYGTHYSGAAATDYHFASGNTLYYLGESNGIRLFSEQLPYKEDFGEGTSLTTYLVTWNNYDNTELTHEYYTEGATPSYKGSDPEKPTDNDYTYTFSGWSPAISEVTEVVTYTAQFTANPRQKYTITWKNYDGEVLDTEEYLEDAMPTYKGSDPTKADDANYYYDFSGWSPSITKVTQSTDYTAQFTPVFKYTIIWKNWDDTVLETEYYREGALDPSYKHNNPTRPADDEYTYTFSGWSPAVNPVVLGDATYVAQYVRTPLVNPDTEILGYSGVLPTTDNKTYEIIGKWYQDKNGDLRVFDLNGAFEEFNSTLYLGDAEVAVIDTNKTLAHTVYITGSGTQEDPYIFYPNYLYGNAGVTNINGTNTVFSVDGVHPGDGFYGNARINVGSGSLVTFMADPEVSQATSYGYIGVGKTNYGYSYSKDKATAYNNHGPYDFDNGKYTLYYLGVNDNDAYVFTIEPLSAHPDFISEFTVSWYNGETLLDEEQYARNADPVYKGDPPTKDEDEDYTYEFDGWDPHLMPVTRDIIYTAKFKKYPKTPSDPIEDIAWIFPTDGVLQYDLEHMYYLYDGQKHLFPGKGFIEEDGNGHITVCDLIVADIVEYNDADTISEFVHTVYVSGTGSYYNPFVFHPNYEYHGPKSIIPNGASLAVGEENIFATTTTIVTYPGDSYKGNTRLRVGDTPAKFLPDEAYHQADDRFLGVGKTTYGYSYDKAIASPYTFSSANDVLYYHGQDDYGFVFAEEPAEYQQSFGDPETYTVTWKNYDGTVLDTDTCYYDDPASYDGETPEKPAYSRFTFTFSGWTDENENEYAEDELPAVTGDVTYTAAYTKTSKLFVLHSLTLNGDIGVNFYLDVTPEEISTGSGVVVNFSWNVEGNIKKSSYKLNTDEYYIEGDKTYYKATCWVAAAEMTYNIHATATINGALEEETDDYDVRKYATKIINAPEGTYEKQDELVELVEAMLDYGSKAQIRFDRNKNDLANGGTDFFSGEETIISKASDMDAYLEDCGLEYYGSSVIYLTETTLRHYYRIVDSTKFTDEVKQGITFDGKPVTYGTKSGLIYFDRKNIAASELDNEYVLSINGHEYQYSALDYSALACSLDDTPFDQSITKQLASTFYRYNIKAKAYFANGEG